MNHLHPQIIDQSQEKYGSRIPLKPFRKHSSQDPRDRIQRKWERMLGPNPQPIPGFDETGIPLRDSRGVVLSRLAFQCCLWWWRPLMKWNQLNPPSCPPNSSSAPQIPANVHTPASQILSPLHFLFLLLVFFSLLSSFSVT